MQESGDEEQGSTGDPDAAGAETAAEDGVDADDPIPTSAVAVEELRAELRALEDAVDNPDERQEVERAIGLVERLPGADLGNGLIRKFTRRDIAEGFVGAILISLPMLVEDGVFDIAEVFLEVPELFVLNVLFVVAMTGGLLYYADFRDVQVTRPIFGLIPRRFTAVLVIAFVTATFTMTLWGRLDGWSDPVVALARISVVWTLCAFGAALGDLLPGESTAPDINDELDELGDRLGIGDEEGRW